MQRRSESQTSDETNTFFKSLETRDDECFTLMKNRGRLRTAVSKSFEADRRSKVYYKGIIGVTRLLLSVSAKTIDIYISFS